jgi:hypothetical protein
MTLEDKVKERISEAPLGSDEKNCLRCILGELTSKKGTSGITVLRELLRQNEEAMRRTRRNKEEANRIQIENTVLKSLLEE